MRNTIRDRFEDPDVFDARGILRDGAVARVRMSMRDSVDDGPLSPAELARRMQMADSERRRRGPVVTDGAGDSLFGLQRPGFRRVEGGSYQEQRDRQQLRDARAQAYADYLSDLEGSWKTPQPATSTGSQQFATPQIGAACTRDGWPGHWAMDDDGEMVCIVDSRATGDSANKTLAQLQRDHATATEAAYAAYAKEISEAWRTK